MLVYFSLSEVLILKNIFIENCLFFIIQLVMFILILKFEGYEFFSHISICGLYKN